MTHEINPSTIKWTEEQLQVIRKLYTSMFMVWHRLKDAGKLTSEEENLLWATTKIMQQIIPTVEYWAGFVLDEYQRKDEFESHLSGDIFKLLQ